jgi:hypothetical protein
VPQIPQWVMRISMSVGANGFGVNVVYVKGLLESWATQPWKSFAGEVMVLVMCGVMRNRYEVFWMF